VNLNVKSEWSGSLRILERLALWRGAWTKPAVDAEGDAAINAGGMAWIRKCGGTS